MPGKGRNLYQDIVIKTLILAAILTIVFGLIIHFFMALPTLELLGGFWIGVIANMIGFAFIVRDAKAMVANDGPKVTLGFFIRILVYGVALFLSFQISVYALVASAVGSSIGSLALKIRPLKEV